MIFWVILLRNFIYLFCITTFWLNLNPHLKASYMLNLNHTGKQKRFIKMQTNVFSLSLQPADNKESGSKNFDEIIEPFIILLSDCDCSVDSRRPFPLLLIRSSLWSEVCFCRGLLCRWRQATDQRPQPNTKNSQIKKQEVRDMWGQRDAPWIRQKQGSAGHLI